MTILKLKSAIPENFKKILNGLVSRMLMTKEGVSELEDISIEMNKSEEKRKKNEKKTQN